MTADPQAHSSPIPGSPAAPPDPFRHVVLTVFNVRLHFGSNTAPDEDWLRHRFGLFESLCYPSMRAQSNQRFTWLVLLDAGTPQTFRDRISACAAWPNFVPCYTDAIMSVDSFQAIRRDLISRHVGNPEYLITTTLDNDDAVHTDYIATIQRQFDCQHYEFVNFPHGFVLDYAGRKLYRKHDTSSPFVSLIERMENFTTVWLASHRELPRFGPMRQVQVPPMWLQVVHGRNVSNNVDLFRRVRLDALGRGFPAPFPGTPVEESGLSLMVENTRTAVRSLIRRLVTR